MQKKAWMDKALMVTWIMKCLLPGKDTLPHDAMPLFILDLLCVHMIGQLVKKIQGLGIEVQDIPSGCSTCANQLTWGE